MSAHPDGLARSAWFGLWTQAIDKLLPVAITLYLARALAPESFGVYSFIIAYLALFQTITEYGLDTVLVRMMTQSPSARGQIFRAGLALKLIIAVGCAVVATVLAGPLSGGQAPMGLMLVAALGLVTAMGAAYRSYFRAAINIRAVLWIAIVRAVILAAAVVGAVVAGLGLYGIFTAMAAANLLAFGVVALAVARTLPPRLTFDRELWRRLMKGVLPLTANALALTVSLRAGQIILMSMRGPLEVGLLGAASRVSEAFTLLPEALMITIYPLMAGLHDNDPARLVATAEKSTRYLIVAAGLPVVLCLVAGDEIMGLLFGDAFARAGDALSVLALMALLSATGTVIINLLAAVHLEGILSRNTIIFAVVNVALCLVLIPTDGYIGAAVAMVATSLASQVCLALLPSTGPLVRPCLFAGLRTVIAVFVGAAVGSAVGPMLSWEAVARGGAALAAYMLTLVLLGVINREEVRFSRSVLAQFSSRSGSPNGD